MDGVLVDVTKSYRAAIQKTAQYFLQRRVAMAEVDAIKQCVGMNNDWDASYALIGNKKINYLDVKNVFQKLYLGDRKNKGLINNERLLLSKENLTLLKKAYGLFGIVTGRPREEALFTLKRFGILKLFSVVVALEDSKLQKPNPDPLFLALKKLKSTNPIYIGDSVSDVAAANAANIPCIYVGKQNIGTYTCSSMSQVVSLLL
jgi:HAD superfamily hydrolase (TIGR01548 family)